jgi:DNA-binding MarR family transcriptional regulator
MSSQLLPQQVSSPALDAWARLLQARAGSARRLSSRLHAQHGLTINDYEALLHLSRAEGYALRRVDLAGRLVLTASGVTRLLDGLERQGYVAKRSCPSDARVSYAVLTETGREKLAAAACSHVAAIEDLFGERFGEEDLAMLVELLGRLPGAAGVAGSSCTPEAAAAQTTTR